MILSFHPLLCGDENILCAGREPDENDLYAIRKADAVVLPLGCKPKLFFMARDNCQFVFPSYDARFKYPGKTGQVRLFRQTGQEHPDTLIYRNLRVFRKNCEHYRYNPPRDFPFVFKFDWGGEGETVFMVRNTGQWNALLEKAEKFEKTGQKGFLLQKYIEAAGKSLRCVAVGKKILSYWRVSKKETEFKNSLSSGAEIDYNSNPELVRRAELSLWRFLRKTGIDLAGFDFLFSENEGIPMMLEINYFFGRRGLGGSRRFNQILAEETNRWLESVGRPEKVRLEDSD